MNIKAGDKVYYKGKKWDVFLIWNDSKVCCLINIITGETIDTLVSSIKPIIRAAK